MLLPLFTYVVSLMTGRNLALQKRVKELENENVSLSTVDPDTGLRNLRTLISDAKIFIGMAKRGQIELSLMLIKFRHYKEIKRILGRGTLTPVYPPDDRGNAPQSAAEEYSLSD